jgi:hypothetical protein
MAAGLKVMPLFATVHVVEVAESGKPRLRQVGFDEAGKPVLEPATRIVFLDRGEAVPDNLPPGELDRLKSIGAVAPADEVDAFVRRLANPAEAAAEDRAAADARLELVREPAAASAQGAALATMTDGQLVGWLRDDKPTVDEVAAAVGDDQVLARRVLAAEETVTGGEPRKTLVEQLDKVGGAE